MWKTFIRPAMIFIPFILGTLFPQAHVLNKPPINLVRWTLIIMMFLSCLQLEFREMKPRREHWLLLAVNIAMGMIPYGLFRLLMPEQPEIALIAFFVGITPTATAAPVVVSFLHGSLGFALTGFAVTNRLTLSWHAEDGASTWAYSPDEVTYGICTWTLGGLLGTGDITLRGTFAFKRILPISKVEE